MAKIEISVKDLRRVPDGSVGSPILEVPADLVDKELISQFGDPSDCLTSSTGIVLQLQGDSLIIGTTLLVRTRVRGAPFARGYRLDCDGRWAEVHGPGLAPHAIPDDEG